MKKEITVNVTLFKESGKYYTDVEVTMAYHESFYDQVIEYKKALSQKMNVSSFHSVCFFEEHPNGYPIMQPFPG